MQPMEHLVKHNSGFYVPMAVVYDESRVIIPHNSVPVLSGSDIGVTPPERADRAVLLPYNGFVGDWD